MDGKALLFDGFEDAFVGYATQAGGIELAVYDYETMLKVLRDRDGMSAGEAVEFLEFNTLCAYVGKGTPLVMRRMKFKHFQEMMPE